MKRNCNNLKKNAGGNGLCRLVFCLAAILPLAACDRKADLVIPPSSALQEDAGTDASADVLADALSGARTDTLSDAGTDVSGMEEGGNADPVSVPIAVHVCGAVVNEGVCELKAGDRVVDAVRAAGGFAPDADESYVNQAAFVTDGMRLKIPTVAETEKLAESGAFQALSDEVLPAACVEQTLPVPGLVNINTATTAELCTLNGIGEARAAEIIRYRETHGAFTRIEDLMKVAGIKEKLFEKIRDGITVS